MDKRGGGNSLPVGEFGDSVTSRHHSPTYFPAELPIIRGHPSLIIAELDLPSCIWPQSKSAAGCPALLCLQLHHKSLSSYPTRGILANFLTFSHLADFVQELYLKELKAYKTPAVKDSDAQGQVLAFNQPKVPKSPEESDLASSLKEYESMAVEVEGQEGADAKSGATAVVEDWLVEEEEEDEHAHGH